MIIRSLLHRSATRALLGTPLFIVLAACNSLLSHDPGSSDAPGDDAGSADASAADGSVVGDASTTHDAGREGSTCEGDACNSPPPVDAAAVCPVPACDGGASCGRVLASSQLGASSIAVYQSNVYWTNNLDGNVMIAPADGSAPARSLVPGQDHPTGIYVESTGVYWAAMGSQAIDGSISRANFDGTNSEMLAQYGNQPYRLTGFNGFLYWSEIGTTVSAMIRMQIDGTNERSISEGLPMTPTSLAIDASGVYWATPSTGTISKAPIDCLYANDHNCARTVTTQVSDAGGVASPLSIAVSNGELFWGDSKDGTVLTSHTDGTCATAACPQVIAKGLKSPTAIVAIDDELYWIDGGSGPTGAGVASNDGAVMFSRRDGSCAAVLASGQASPVALAVDGARVYWLNGGTAPAFADGAAMSLARPGR